VRLEDLAPEQALAVSRREFGERAPGALAFEDAALAEGDPSLADRRVCGLEPLPAPDALAVLGLQKKKVLRQSRICH
jgi:hypothetical protein